MTTIPSGAYDLGMEEVELDDRGCCCCFPQYDAKSVADPKEGRESRVAVGGAADCGFELIISVGGVGLDSREVWGVTVEGLGGAG